MRRVTIKGMRGHLVRFLLTALAVTLGVAFVAGSFVLRDSMNNTLDDLLNSAVRGVDVGVRGQHTGDDGPRQPLTLDLTERLATVDGVVNVRPDLQGNAMIVGKDGLVVRNGGAPTLGFAYQPGDASFTLVDGRQPTGPGEIAVERATLEKAGLRVGDTTRALIGDDAREVRITGEVTFGSLFGATAVLLDKATAQTAFAPDGKIGGISLTAAAGLSQDELRDRVAPLLPAGAEAVTGQDLREEARKDVEQVTSIFTTFLLVFAGVALFVGAFIIVNTFSIVLAQRTRELALLRAVGASRGQIRRMVLAESAVIGFVGSALGIGLGVALAAGLKAVMKGMLGLDIGGGLPVGGQAVWVSIVVGVLVTVVAALLPARRAARVPPIAAMRDDMVAPPSSIRRRGAAGVVLFALASALLTYQVTRSEISWGPASLGFVLVIIGALVAAPLLTRPVVRVITWPFQRWGGVVGRLAGQNALRVPRRTANTASALMIGLALVAGLSVVASSAKASLAGLVERQLTADFVLSAGGQSPVPPGALSAAEKVDGVRSVAGLGFVPLTTPGLDTTASSARATALAQGVRIDMAEGALSALDSGRLLVDRTTADERGWKVGTSVTADVGTLKGERLTVGGVYQDNQFLGPAVVPRQLYERALPQAQRGDFFALVNLAPGADAGAVRSALTELAKPYFTISVESGSEYVDSASASVDQLLALLYVLLALSIVIAVLGIINTLALSVVERTREIGLLRAVGLARGQLSRMITIESVATALFGAVLGSVLGIGLGAALQHAMRGDGLDVLAVPWPTIATVLVASGAVGVVAAVLPAIRAVRLDVLQAIATD